MKSLKMTYVILITALLSFFSQSIMAGKNPYLVPNNTWITISGVVENVKPDAFDLDYGDGVIKVEMDDGDRDADGYKLIKGDKVTVNGKIDDDFHEMTKIEAGSVYVEKLDTFFYASAVDEEDYSLWSTIPVVPGEVTVVGTVTKVMDDEFTLNTGLRSITVDVDDMSYNPLDNRGYQKIDKGDLVRVSGKLEDKFFSDKKELEAKYIVTIVN